MWRWRFDLDDFNISATTQKVLNRHPHIIDAISVNNRINRWVEMGDANRKQEESAPHLVAGEESKILFDCQNHVQNCKRSPWDDETSDNQRKGFCNANFIFLNRTFLAFDWFCWTGSSRIFPPKLWERDESLAYRNLFVSSIWAPFIYNVIINYGEDYHPLDKYFSRILLRIFRTKLFHGLIMTSIMNGTTFKLTLTCMEML